MDEARLAELQRRMRAHLASTGGIADETYCLDFMEVKLAQFPEGYDTLTELIARAALLCPGMVPGFIEASRDDLLFWKVVEAMVRLSRSLAPEDYNVSAEAFQCLNEWALDVATGVRQKPKDGPDKRKNLLRNATIIATVESIRAVGGIPYEFDEPKTGEPRSACHVVADRLGWTPSKVRSIWRKGQSIRRRVQMRGVVPPPRKRARRVR